MRPGKAETPYARRGVGMPARGLSSSLGSASGACGGKSGVSPFWTELTDLAPGGRPSLARPSTLSSAASVDAGRGKRGLIPGVASLGLGGMWREGSPSGPATSSSGPNRYTEVPSGKRSIRSSGFSSRSGDNVRATTATRGLDLRPVRPDGCAGSQASRRDPIRRTALF
jgi:hypothetical protein